MALLADTRDVPVKVRFEYGLNAFARSLFRTVAEEHDANNLSWNLRMSSYTVTLIPVLSRYKIIFRTLVEAPHPKSRFRTIIANWSRKSGIRFWNDWRRSCDTYYVIFT